MIQGIGEIFGWAKKRKARHRSQDRVGWAFTLTVAAYSLVRLPQSLTP